LGTLIRVLEGLSLTPGFLRGAKFDQIQYGLNSENSLEGLSLTPGFLRGAKFDPTFRPGLRRLVVRNSLEGLSLTQNSLEGLSLTKWGSPGSKMGSRGPKRGSWGSKRGQIGSKGAILTPFCPFFGGPRILKYGLKGGPFSRIHLFSSRFALITFFCPFRMPL